MARATRGGRVIDRRIVVGTTSARARESNAIRQPRGSNRRVSDCARMIGGRVGLLTVPGTGIGCDGAIGGRARYDDASASCIAAMASQRGSGRPSGSGLVSPVPGRVR